MRESEASWQVIRSRLRHPPQLLLARVVEEKLAQVSTARSRPISIPTEPRVPRGNPDGGQWAGTGGSGGRTRLAQMPRGGGRIGSDAEGHARAGSEARFRGGPGSGGDKPFRRLMPLEARGISLIDPNSIEGQIATARGPRRRGRGPRSIERAKQPADSLIDAYRRQQGFDLLGEPNWSRRENSVALCKVGDQPSSRNSQAITSPKR